MIVSIIGVGLIGGSIGLALKKLKVKSKKLKVIGVGRNIERLRLAKKLGAVDVITTDLKIGVKDADIIFVCLPVGLIADTVKKIAPFCKKNAIITDVGSVKSSIVSDVEKFLSPITYPLSPAFIGGHPIAGAEKTSVRHAHEKLFNKATIVLTPTENSNKVALIKMDKLWKAMGGKVRIMSPQKHDAILAETSHLPHIIAFALVNATANLKYAGSGFRDTTRIASSDPVIWADIIFNNRINVRLSLREFKKELFKIEKANSTKKLVNIFKKAKIKRDNLIQKQDESFPNKCSEMTNVGRKKSLDKTRVLKFIEDSLKRRKIPPTTRETAKYFDISVSTAHSYLKDLCKKKILKTRKVQNKNRIVARGISVK